MIEAKYLLESEVKKLVDKAYKEGYDEGFADAEEGIVKESESLSMTLARLDMPHS